MKRTDHTRKKVELSKTASRVLTDLSVEETNKLEELRTLCEKYKRNSGHTKSELQSEIKQHGISPATFYRRRGEYEKAGTLSSLLPPRKNATRAKRLSAKVEEIVQLEIKRLQEGGIVSPTEMHRNIDGAIYEENMKHQHAGELVAPSVTTIRNRVLAVPKYDAAVRAIGKRRASRLFGPIPGETPPQEFPLSRVQIDHTIVDIMVINEITGQPLRRPWITLAIDEMSRSILGMVLSFEPPSSTKLARFMVNMIYPKDDYMNELGLDFDWPMHGKPNCIFTDNGSDFTSRAFDLGNREYNILHEKRPVGEAHYGGHIERLIGTAMGRVKMLKGRTRDAWMKEIYKFDPSKTATMTMERLERWIIRWITGDYHNTQRKELGYLTPNDAWYSAFKPGSNNPAPAPYVPPNKEQFYLNYLPVGGRSLQRGHLEAFALKYWDEALEPFVRRQSEREYEIRFDVHDISSIWFRNPDNGHFINIRCKDRAIGPLTLAEWKLTNKKAREMGKNPKAIENRKRALAELRREAIEADSEAVRLKKAYEISRKKTNSRIASRTMDNATEKATSCSVKPKVRRRKPIPKRIPIVDRE